MVGKVGLRFDLTVPSRYVAENQGTLTLPFKRVQIGNSYRGEKPQKGRYREFCQADIDIVGVGSLAADVEVLIRVLENLNRFVPSTFTMLVGHRVILSSLIRQLLPGLNEGSEKKALIALDKLAKIGREKVIELLTEIENSELAGASALDVLDERDESGNTSIDAIRRA